MMFARAAAHPSAAGTVTAIPKIEIPVEAMDLDQCRAALMESRMRADQLEHVLHRIIFEFDRNLGALFTLPSMDEAKTLVSWKK